MKKHKKYRYSRVQMEYLASVTPPSMKTVDGAAREAFVAAFRARFPTVPAWVKDSSLIRKCWKMHGKTVAIVPPKARVAKVINNKVGRGPLHTYTPEQDQFIIGLGERSGSWKRRAAKFNRTFGCKVTSRSIQQHFYVLRKRGAIPVAPAAEAKVMACAPGASFILLVDGVQVWSGSKRPNVELRSVTTETL